MIIEYCNAKEPRNHARLSVVIVVASCAFFFIPTTLIVLGYLSSQPTGSLISPLPQGVLSDVGANRDSPILPSPSPSRDLPSDIQQPIQSPIIAAPNESTASADRNIAPEAQSNMTDKSASVSAGLIEALVTDVDIKATSQIYLSVRPGDSSIYSVKSKAEGQMIIEANKTSDIVRYVDYHIVNP